LEGFDPVLYPGDGPYLTTDRQLAEEFQKAYTNGLQVFHVPRAMFQSLLDQGIIKRDPHIEDRLSYHVPAQGLGIFNEAIEKGSTNVYYPEQSD
jgi:hypothetical protein